MQLGGGAPLLAKTTLAKSMSMRRAKDTSCDTCCLCRHKGSYVMKSLHAQYLRGLYV